MVDGDSDGDDDNKDGDAEVPENHKSIRHFRLYSGLFSI